MKRWLLAATILLGGSAASAWADYIVIIVDPTKKQETTTPPGQTNPMQGGRPREGGPGMPPMGGMGNTGGGTSTATAPPVEPEGTKVIDFGGVSEKIAAVIEVKEPFNAAQVLSYQEYEALVKAYASGQPPQNSKVQPPQPIPISGPWGKATIYPVLGEKSEIQIAIIPNKDKNTLFVRMFDWKTKQGTSAKPEKPDTLFVLTLADWCLRHGHLKEFTEVMEQFVKDESMHPAAVAYLKVKQDLDKLPKMPETNALRSSLLADWHTSIADSRHYVAYFSPTQRGDLPPEVKSRLKLLEKNLESYYYWFALRGTALPVPTERLTVVVTYKDEEFKMLGDQLTASPVAGDGFVGRREGVLVLSSRRRDAQYSLFENHTKHYWTDGLDPNLVLSKPDTAFSNTKYQTPGLRWSVQSLALAKHTLEIEGERATVTNDGSRQLLYASGLLNRNVVAPEWVQFGMGSFFETPLGTPFISTASASTEYLPLFKDLKTAKQLGKSKEHPDYDPVETLRKIVTDDYFRKAQKDRQSSKEGGLASLRRARATSWALMYFLAQGNNKLDGDKRYLDGLQRYFKELAKLPRDMELDDAVLLTCFCKSFGLMKGEQGDQIDEVKFEKFAMRWDTFMNEERLELQDIMDKIHDQTTKHMYVNTDGERIIQKEPSTGTTTPPPMGGMGGGYQRP